MAISLEQLEGYLLQGDLEYAIDDEGRYAEICGQRLYDARREVDVGRLAELLLHSGSCHRQVRCGLDRSDGEVQVTMPFDPVDATVTCEAIIRSPRWLPGFIDVWHAIIHPAITVGELPGIDRISGHPEIARMITQAGGVERFAEIVAQARGGDPAAAATVEPKPRRSR